MPDTDDRSLVVAIRNGNMAAFQAIYKRYAKPLYQFLWHRTPDRETAADLVQETFTKIWEIRQTLDPERSLRALIYKMARNLAVDGLRKLVKQGTSVEIFETLEAPPSDPEAFVKRDRVRDAIRALSDQQRKVFCLSRFDGLSYLEISEVLGITIKTVEVHMGRALKKLRETLHDLAQFIFFTPWL